MKYIYKTIPILVSIAFSTVLVIFNKSIQNTKVVEDEFMLNFIGLFLGLSIAVITFLFSIVENIQRNICENNHMKSERKTNINTLIKQLYNEIKDDIFAIFVFFIMCFLLIVCKDTDIPCISWPAIFSKLQFTIWLKLIINFLTLYCLYDIIGALFKLINTVHLLSISNDKDKKKNTETT